MRYKAEREAVVEAAQAMSEAGLVVGTSGNVSCRVEDRVIAITPSGTPYATMTAADILLVDLDGAVVEEVEGRLPSVETAIHTGVMAARPELNAVVHTHAQHASMFAVAHRPIPGIIDEFAVEIGAEVPVANYGISGSEALAASVVEAFGTYGKATLMANHGLVVGDIDLPHALELTLHIDRTAEIVFGAVLLGGAVPLPDEALNLYTTVYEYKVQQQQKG